MNAEDLAEDLTCLSDLYEALAAEDGRYRWLEMFARDLAQQIRDNAE